MSIEKLKELLDLTETNSDAEVIEQAVKKIQNLEKALMLITSQVQANCRLLKSSQKNYGNEFECTHYVRNQITDLVCQNFRNTLADAVKIKTNNDSLDPLDEIPF